MIEILPNWHPILVHFTVALFTLSFAFYFLAFVFQSLANPRPIASEFEIVARWSLCQTFHYAFTLKQAGTYWYHAHAGLQEQQGLYGAFIIDPKNQPQYNYNKDYVVVLSDWSNTHPDQIFANLKKEGDYYSPRFPLQPSSKHRSKY